MLKDVFKASTEQTPITDANISWTRKGKIPSFLFSYINLSGQMCIYQSPIVMLVNVLRTHTVHSLIAIRGSTKFHSLSLSKLLKHTLFIYMQTQRFYYPSSNFEVLLSLCWGNYDLPFVVIVVGERRVAISHHLEKLSDLNWP